MIAFLSQYAPSETVHLIETNIQQLMKSQSGKWLSFSVLATVWAASNGMSAIIRALNRAYDVKETRSFSCCARYFYLTYICHDFRHYCRACFPCIR